MGRTNGSGVLLGKHWLVFINNIKGLLSLFAVIFDGLLDQFLHELRVFPDPRDFSAAPDEHSFAVLDVVLKFANIDSSIWIDFLSMPITDSVFKEAGDLGSIVECVGTVTSHTGFSILTYVFITKLEIRDHPAVKVASLELALEYSIHILQISCAVELSVLEFSFVVKPWLR